MIGQSRLTVTDGVVSSQVSTIQLPTVPPTHTNITSTITASTLQSSTSNSISFTESSSSNSTSTSAPAAAVSDSLDTMTIVFIVLGIVAALVVFGLIGIVWFVKRDG